MKIEIKANNGETFIVNVKSEKIQPLIKYAANMSYFERVIYGIPNAEKIRAYADRLANLRGIKGGTEGFRVIEK